MQIILCAGQNGRAVIYGTVDKEPVPGKPVKLTDARMVIRWGSSCGGLFGLAAKGPSGDTRITHAVKQTRETVWQEWIEVSHGAADKIASWAPYNE